MNPRRSLLACLITLLLGVSLLGGGCATGTNSGSPGDDGSSDGTLDDGEGGPCSSGKALCGTTCTNTDNDPKNCGMCGKACAAGQLCSQGMCGAGCTTGYTLCGGPVDSGGVEAASAPETGATPAGDSGEDSGEDSGLEDAATVVDSGTAGIGNDAGVSDGGPEYCANLNTDPSNCGGCGMACGPNGLCSGGMCTVSCPTGQKGCPASGTCIPENTCCQSGECTITGEVCPTPGGTCACPAGERECAGTVMSCISDSACCTDADCNMNGVTGQKCTTPGTPCTCQTGLQCCVAADCPSVPNVATDACTVNKCSVASCVRGCYDLDMMFANGCECCDSVYGKTCATATAGGALTVGMTPLTYTGSIPEMGGSSLGDWFSVTFSGESNTAFHGLIQLTSGAGEFVFDILQSSCSGAPMACGTEGGSCTGKTAWEESYVGPNPAGDPTSVSPSGASNFTAIPAVGTVFIHVYRANASAPPDCNAYKLSIQE